VPNAECLWISDKNEHRSCKFCLQTFLNDHNTIATLDVKLTVSEVHLGCKAHNANLQKQTCNGS